MILWLRHGSRGRASKLPDDGYLYTEWNTQIVLRIPQTRWTHGGRLGIGWRPLRLWLRVEVERRRSRYL